MEAHYFFTDNLIPFGGASNCPKSRIKLTPDNPYFNCTEFAQGPFVAIEVGGGTTSTPTTGPITAFAMGWMVGVRHPNASNASWNFGVGFRVDPSAQFLGPGIVANQPLPLGEVPTNPVRTIKQPSYGVMLVSSFSFVSPLNAP
jgi:hypothetical protein